MLVSSFCLLLAIGNTIAVVNNVPTSKSSFESTSSSVTSTDTATKDASSETIADSIGASSETEANKREGIVDIGNNFPTVGLLDGLYGAPIDSYLPASTLNVNVPLPVYGAPNVGPNIIYSTPPPDIPPPLPSLPTLPLTYGVPSSISTAPKDFYAPLKFLYGPPKNKPIKTKYGLPFFQRPPKPINPSTFFASKTPKPVYGPPRIHKPHIHKLPKFQYGPPKLQNSPPKFTYGPPKQVQIQTTTLYIPPTTGALLTSPVNRPVLSPPPLTQSYGVPNINVNIIKEELPLTVLPQKLYGPPEPVPHGPPHPGIPAPPTPPDIKYDGWQPIPGLISRPPSDNYGVPNANPDNQGSYDIQINGDFIPPPIGDTGVHSLSLQESYKGNGVVSDSYGAPLNTVTGSGGIDATSGEEHHQQSQGSINIGVNNELNQQEQQDHQSNVNIGLSAIGIGGQDNSLSVIKSVGYQLSPNYALEYTGTYQNGHDDSYTAPPLNSYSSNGPYPLAQPFKSNILSQSSSSFGSSFNSGYNSHTFGKGISLSPTGAGLIPPSGVYGITPNSQYGTPLFQSGNQNFNSFRIPPPKRPVIFREPVPAGLIQSIGNSVAQKDASGIIDSIYSNNVGPTYIPPPVPDIIKPVKEARPLVPSNLYSLPHSSRPLSFQNFVQGSSTAGLTSQFDAAFNLNTANDYNFAGGAHTNGDYQANFGTLHGAYALPLQTSSVAFNSNQNQNKQLYHKQFNYNQLSNGQGGGNYNLFSGGNNYGLGNAGSYRNTQHDCNVHASQPLPSLSYGVPSGSGGYQTQPAFTYGTPDLQASHSQSTVSLSNGASNVDNSISQFTKDSYAKSLGESFANGGEVIQSESLDLNNIPLQGALGSYTLQIQSADGLGSSGPDPNNVPHEQVLNDGLLQSILAAIEQPQGNIQVQADQSQSYSQISDAPVQVSELESRLDEEAQHSVKNAVVVIPPLQNNQQNSNNTSPQDDDSDSLHLIDDNEIAVYFNNTNAQRNEGSVETEEESHEARNGQQYGSYVAFKTPTSSYVYGDLDLTDEKESLVPSKKE